MTPKEKAKELVGKCKIEIYNEVPALQSNMFHLCILKSAKHCALIAVDEILNSNPHIYIEKGGSDCRGDWSYKEAQSNQLYWQEVKQEIEKL
jgi:hypothetical protein